jgi:ceramide glucosyltransferase
MPSIQLFMTIAGFACLGFAAGYSSIMVVATLAWQMQKRESSSLRHPPISLLKPLCGAEPGLYEHLRTFCQQDYPEFQIVFGVRDPGDPACAVVKQLAAEFPAVPIDLVVDPRVHGNNLKISNLINMVAYARHDMMVMADSDAFVESDYLAAVTAPLHDPNVGLVTCIYRGIPTRNLWSRLGAMYINEWYLPSVMLAWLFGHQRYVSGQTICLRRDTLQAIGGLQTLVNHLADDYQLGELIHGLGLQIVLSPYLVRGVHHEPNFGSLIRHESRWMRTIHVLQPWAFRMIFVTFSLPVAVFGLAAVAAGSTLSTAAWVLLGTTMTARLLQHFVHRRGDDRAATSDLWLLPVRDFLIGWVWFRSFFTSHVTWRGKEFAVDADGVMHSLS